MTIDNEVKYGAGTNLDPGQLTAKEFWRGQDGEVSAKTLWQFLHVKKCFEQWLGPRLYELDAREGVDYRIGSRQDTTSGGASHDAASRSAQIDVFLTPDLAMEIGILECNIRGRETRRYFINAHEEYLRRRREILSRMN